MTRFGAIGPGPTPLRDAGALSIKSKPKARIGRPPTRGEPWKAEGVSRRTWYRRHKAKRNEGKTA